MATKKISAMTAAGALAGTEVAEVVQSGASKKVALSLIGLIAKTFAQLNTQISDAVIARKDATQTFTGAQQTNMTTLADAATIAIDATANNSFKVTITAARILGNPTGPVVAGMSWTVEIIQGGAGLFALTFDTNYVGPASATGASPLDTTGDAAGKIRLLSCYAHSATKISVMDMGEAV